MPRSRLCPVPLAGVLALGAAMPAAAAPPMALLPHHAVYKLTLANATGSKAPADANGMIAYDFSGSACAGYTTVFRQVTELQPPEGDARVSVTKTTTVESGNADRFQFDIDTTVNQGAPDDVQGVATRQDGAVDVDLQKPEAATVDLKGDPLFPTEHLERIIAAGEAGTKILTAAVYDGSETGRKVFNTLAVIGAPLTTPAADKAAQDAALTNVRRWPVTISYFEKGSDDAMPAYVLSFELYENGVSRALKINYGSFSLQGDLVEFKPEAATTCSK